MNHDDTSATLDTAADDLLGLWFELAECGWRWQEQLWQATLDAWFPWLRPAGLQWPSEDLITRRGWEQLA